MTTTICTLTFRDGKTLTGRVTSAHATDDERVKWEGDTSALHRSARNESSASLICLCEIAAKATGATLDVQYEGANWPDEADVIFAE